jgi:hypothetical protein
MYTSFGERFDMVDLRRRIPAYIAAIIPQVKLCGQFIFSEWNDQATVSACGAVSAIDGMEPSMVTMPLLRPRPSTRLRVVLDKVRLPVLAVSRSPFSVALALAFATDIDVPVTAPTVAVELVQRFGLAALPASFHATDGNGNHRRAVVA